MGKRKIFPGQRYGRFTTLECTKINKYNKRVVKVKCDCGRKEERDAHALVQGHGRSCNFCRSIIKPGQKYGKLLVLDFPKKRVVEVKCDCGNIVKKNVDYIKSGNVKSCGLCRRTQAITEDLSGKKFNRLTVLGFNYTNGQRRFWECLCDCGNKTLVSTHKIKSGLTKSCGCLNRDKGSEPGEFGLKYLYRNIKANAKNRKIPFNLTLKEVKQITQRDCFYCKSKPSMKGRKSLPERSIYTHNGIDRKNSKKGYTLENSVPCCKICNWMKSNLTEKQFKNHIRKIFNHYVKL